ncbi:MAG: CHAP domain-containing protein [Candidatus Dojkabacteria bacterium]
MQAAWTYGDDYPYPNGSGVDPWNMYIRQCTSYSAHKADQIIGNFNNQMEGPNGTSGTFGNAKNWDENATSIGFPVLTSPKVGTITSVYQNKEGAGNYGHVAYIETVHTNGKFDLSEYNWWPNSRSYNERYNRQNSQWYTFIDFGGGSCSPSPNQDWIITSDCEITSNINFDFTNYKIVIQNGAKLDITNGAKIY